jgi:hypothetical protein
MKVENQTRAGSGVTIFENNTVKELFNTAGNFSNNE